MKKLETDKFQIESKEREIIENFDASTEYCDRCFIAFGSQENRIYKDRKKFHKDCESRT